LTAAFRFVHTLQRGRVDSNNVYEIPILFPVPRTG
jgi:hypothetical protein